MLIRGEVSDGYTRGEVDSPPPMCRVTVELTVRARDAKAVLARLLETGWEIGLSANAQ